MKATHGMSAIVIALSLPDPRLRPNNAPFSRGAALGKARAAREYRETAYLVTLACIAAAARKPPHWTHATERTTWFLGRRQKRLDDDNAIASLKPAFDGIQDAGLIENDRGLRHASPVWERDTKNPRVEILITQRDDRP